MRNAAAVLLAAAVSQFAFGQPVTMKRPHIVYRASEGVAAACASAKEACTKIQTEFYCGCEHVERGWVAAPRIIAQPSIFSTSDSLLRHEQEHIVDVQKSLNEYAASIVMHSFPSATACTEFVDGEAKGFSRTMKSIERATTIKRDGIRYAGPPVD